jgi:hypothetical protein
MPEENSELVNPSPPKLIGQSVACASQSKPTDSVAHFQIPETGLSRDIVESSYSGYEPGLLSIGCEDYYLQPTARRTDERQHPRIPYRNIKACIKREQGSMVIVTLTNISQGGVGFTSSAEFCPGTPVTIAVHYIEGGQNIFQTARIVRVQQRPSAMEPGRYGLEF